MLKPVTNSLGGVVNQDISKMLLKSDMVVDSENFRVVTDDGGTTASRVNIRGQEFTLSVPDIPAVNKLSITSNSLPSFHFYNITINVSGVDHTIITLYSYSIEDVFIQLAGYFNDVAFIPCTLVLAGNQSYIDFGNNTVYIVSVILDVLGTITDYTSNVTWGIETKPGYVDLRIIGWCALRDDIYLLTTNCTDDPNTTTIVSNGQWWKFSYDKSGDMTDPNNYSLTLIYNNALNVTTKRPVANPGMIEVRYENKDIQKIYWTDNLNILRVINVADPSVQLKTPEELNLISAIDFDIPILTKIGVGTLLTGMYQFVYRLKRNNGAESRFSLPSSPIFLNNMPEDTTPFNKYQATKSEEDSGKSITLKIDNIDSSFNKIEVVALYYKTEGALPICNIMYESYINEQSSFTVTYAGSETLVELTIDEITAFAPNIRRAKSLASKYNTLFLSNVLLSDQNVGWDARAYRFPFGSTQTIIKDVAGNSYTVDSTLGFDILNSDTTHQAVPENHDAIQDYASQAPYLDTNNLYQPNSTNHLFDLGGEGKNIKYQFHEISIVQDYLIPSKTELEAPYRDIDGKQPDIVYLKDHQYSTGGFYKSHISPYMMPLLAGYQRDEMYRFAIVFYDDQGNESFAKWIADIRMPSVFMPVGSTKGDVDSMFPLVSTTNNYVRSKTIVVEFTVDTTTLSSDIKGYSIVVVPREDVDKRVLGQGIISPMFRTFDTDNNIDKRTLWSCPNGVDDTNTGNSYFGTNENQNVTIPYWRHAMTFKSPEFDFNGYPKYKQGDTFEITSLMFEEQKCWVKESWFGSSLVGHNLADWPEVSGAVFKQYLTKNTGVNPRPIKDPTSSGPEYNILDTKVFSPFVNNQSTIFTWDYLSSNWDTLVPEYTGYDPILINASPKSFAGQRASRATGRLGIIYGENANNSYQDFNPITSDFAGQDGWDSDNSRIYVANYKRSVTNQYGGNSYSQRAHNVYRYPNNYHRIVKGTPIANTRVAEGDTYTLVHDTVYEFPDFSRKYTTSSLPFDLNVTDVGYTNVARRVAWRIYSFPTEVSVNTSLRADSKIGGHNIPNRDNITGDFTVGGGNLNWEEAYKKEDQNLYSWLPNIRNFYAKPFDVTVSNEFDCRTYKSEPKTNNETVDSWATFRPSAYLDVESKYGPITNLIVFRDKLLFFQERGFGGFQVADKQALQAEDNTQLYIGTSGILDRYEYASTSIGSKHQFSFAQSDQSLIWFDTLSRKLYRLKDNVEPLSDLKGMSAFFFNNTNSDLQISDNPYEDIGVHATYDTRHGEFLISLLNSTSDKYYTVAYSELFDGFCGRYTYTPKVFINDKLNMFEVPSGNNLPGALFASNYGKYGVFYEHPSNPTRPQDSKVSFIINQEPSLEKVLTNMEVLTEAYTPTLDYKLLNQYAIPQPNDFFNKIRIFNSYQNTDVLPLAGISKRRKTIWNVKVPGNRVLYTGGNFDIFDPVNIATNRTAITERLKDRYFIAELYYDNKRNNKFVASSVNSLVMLNPR